jgi:MFS superfamily sulfate permease-like transporter
MVLANAGALRRDVLAGIAVASVSLPICLATGLLLFGQLGPAYYPAGVAASLYGFIFGGAVAALLGRSSFLVSSPRASTALVQASLLASVAASTATLQEPVLIVAATALCVLLAGVWQLAFGIARIPRIIKFTPHPVLAGFIDGIALLIIASQVKSFVSRPAALVFVVVLAGFVLLFGRWQSRIPAGLAGLVAGVAAFHAGSRLFPDVDLGPVLGPITLALPPRTPLADLLQPSARGAIEEVVGPVVLTSLALAVVATLESLLSFRAAQSLSPDAVSPARDLVAQGLGNCASAAAGGMTITASPLQSAAAYRAGARGRLASLTAIALIAALVVAAPAAVAAIPIVVLSALLVATGALLVDRWSARLVVEALKSTPSIRRRRLLGDLVVVAVVMVLTAAVSVVAGIVAGSILAGLIFIINMSRPIIRRQSTCDVLLSKRVRPAADARILRETGARRRALELEGVLFFGNADELSRTVRELFERCDSIVLDLRGVSDIDVTGANILQGLLAASRASGKTLLFCSVPPVQAGLSDRAFPDLDAALEWMEERVLLAQAAERAAVEALTLWQHPLLEGLDASERDALEPHLVPRRFNAGTTLCAQGSSADRMWLLVRGSVSVRVQKTGAGSLRVASCAPGTAVGEMALLQFGNRSASVVADEDVEAWELTRESFEWLSQARPQTAAKLLKNMATELSQRLRSRTEDLRHALT